MAVLHTEGELKTVEKVCIGDQRRQDMVDLYYFWANQFLFLDTIVYQGESHIQSKTQLKFGPVQERFYLMISKLISAMSHLLAVWE